MSDAVKVGFVPFSTAPRGILVAFCDDALKLGPVTRKILGKAEGLVKRAAATSQFRGKSGSALDILEPEGIKVQRLIVLGAGKASDLKEKDFLKFGGVLAGKLNSSSEAVTVVAELPEGAMQPDQAAAIATGVRLRTYKFDRYKTKKKDGEERGLRADVSVAVEDAAAAKKAFAPGAAVVDGVILARELVNEPPNVLYPEEFARRAAQLKKIGVDIEILDVKAMAKLGMGALLGVAQGSARPGRTRDHALERRQEGRAAGRLRRQGRLLRYRRHLDQAGAASMEDMKGDMGGAACVVGLMHALAARKARVERGRRHRPRREHARRQRPASRRHRHLDVRPDHRDHQYRRGRPARAGRRALVRGEKVQAEIHDRSRDAYGRDHGRARHGKRRPVLQQ